MKFLLCAGLLAVLALSFLPAAKAQTLDIYFIDVEGGGATLIVTPERESILIDTGWRRDDARDAERIVRVLKDQAGLERIDFLVITHFHPAHYGGVLRLSQMVPIGEFFDRGPVSFLAEDPQFRMHYAEYMMAARGGRQTLRPGERLPNKKGSRPVSITCLTAGNAVIKTGGSANSECGAVKPVGKVQYDEESASISLLVQFGNFRFFHGANLSLKTESDLICPENRVGRVHAWLVNRHGLKSINSAVFARSLSPVVTITSNGADRGCDAEIVTLLRSLPGVKASYQLHKNLKNRPEDNAPEDFIANTGPEKGCEGHWLRLRVNPAENGFQVTNSRNGITNSYPIE
jgi:competence protein ComEC